jgi:polysaccharide export outer membrane protein
MRILFLSATLLLVAGCGNPDRLNSSPYLTVQEDGLPTPTIADIAPAPRQYVLAPRDFISVTVFGLPDMSLERIQVDNSGNISVPLAGTFFVNGKQPGEVSREVEARLRQEHVREPRVAINVLETESQLVTVDGEVGLPGQYPVLGRMTLTDAISSAQGASQFAALNYVVVFREVGEQRYAGLYDLRAIRSGLAEDPEIYSGDSILVGESRARRIFSDVLAASPLLVAPIITLLQR